MFVFLNGSFLEASEASVSLFDGGYLYGDGLFETVRLYAGRPFRLEEHLRRLQRGLELLGFGWSPDLESVQAAVCELAARNGMADQDSRARLTVSRGGSAADLLPLANLEEIEPNFSIILSPLPAELAAWQQDGIQVKLMKSAFCRGNFPQLKTTNYLPSLLALRFTAEDSCPEAILINQRGQVLEGATSNVFLVRGEKLVTPPSRLGLLPGLTRALVLAAAEKLGFPAEEVACDRRDLVTADEVFLTSTVKEITPVVKVDGDRVGDGKPGPRTQALQQQYRQDVRNALADLVS